MDMKTLYIDGQLQQGSSDEYFTTYNPANGEPLAEIVQANSEDLAFAIESAKKRLRHLVCDEPH